MSPNFDLCYLDLDLDLDLDLNLTFEILQVLKLMNVNKVDQLRLPS